MSEGGPEDYNYSTDEDASGDLGEEDPRPMSVSEKKLLYRIIDSEALKQVQVRASLVRATRYASHSAADASACMRCTAATAPALVSLQLVLALTDDWCAHSAWPQRCGPCVRLRLQGDAVADVAGIWNCKKSVAKTLLMHYMWDKDKLMSECAPDPGLAVQLLQGAHSQAQHASAPPVLLQQPVHLWRIAGTSKHLC